VFLMQLDRLEILSQQVCDAVASSFISPSLQDRNAFHRKEGASIPASQQRNEMLSRAKEADQQRKLLEVGGKGDSA